MKGAADANRGEAGAEIETDIPTSWVGFQTEADQEIGSWEAVETARASFRRPEADMQAMFLHRIQGKRVIFVFRNLNSANIVFVFDELAQFCTLKLTVVQI